jgi:hypothetical protein
MKILLVFYLKSKMVAGRYPAALGFFVAGIGDALMEVGRRWAFGSLDRLAQLESEAQQ